MRGARGAAMTLVFAPVFVTAFALGAPKASPPPPPLSPLPMLPSVARVTMTVVGAHVLVVQDVTLPRGEWGGESLDFYVAFGAPGAPRAVDVRLVPIGVGLLEPEDDDAGEVLTTDRAPRRPLSAYPLLGREAMAGVVVHVNKESLARALGPASMAALRVRTALDLPEEDSAGARSVLVRLGASRGVPLALGRLSAVSRPGSRPITRAEARLCGPDADPQPLAIALVPRVKPPDSGGAPRPLAPILAVRHANDDLCVRFWTGS